MQQAPDDISWTLDQAEFDDFLALKKVSAPGPDGIPAVSAGVLVVWVRSSSLMLTKLFWKEVPFPDCFAERRTVFIPKTSDIDDHGRIIRSPDALRSLTMCNCDCKLLTSAICRGPHWYTMRCIHTSQRCISSRQMTDNILEIETTVLGHVACAPQESGILLTDFAAAYPSVNHSWIFSVLENTGLPEFLCRFLRSIYRDSITHVEFAGAERGQFLMARGVRQGCPVSGFLFAMPFDPMFRWLQETIIPENPDSLDFLQPAQCAYAGDLAIASSSFGDLMLNLNYRKCCWIQYGTEEHDSLRTWFSENCEEFCEIQIVRHAKKGWNNDWP